MDPNTATAAPPAELPNTSIVPPTSTFSQRMTAALTGASETPANTGIDPDLAQAQAMQAAADAAKAKQAAPVETKTADTEASEASVKKGLDAFADEEPAKETTETEVEEEAPAGVRTKEAREAWKAGRLAQKQIPVLQKEIEEWKAKAEAAAKLGDADPLKKQIEELQKRDAEREQEASIWRIERTSAYQEAISKPLEALDAAVMEIAKDNEVSADKLFDAITEPDKKARRERMAEITENLPDDERYRLYEISSKTHEIFAKRAEMEKNAHAAYTEAKAREAEAATKASTERRAAEMRAVTEMQPKILKAAAALVKEGELPEAFAERIITEANAVPFDEQTAETRAFQAVAAKLFDEMAPRYKSALAEIEKLKRQISGMSASSPRASTGSPSNGSSNVPAAGTFGQRMREAMAASGWGG